MSPILKRDVGEQIRQAKRLAAAVTGHPLDHERDQYQYHSHSEYEEVEGGGNAYATSSSSRIGIGEDEDDPGPPRRSWEGRTFVSPSTSAKGKERAIEEEDEVQEGVAMLGFDHEDLNLNEGTMRYEGGRGRNLGEWFKDEVLTMTPGRWIDLRNLLLEVRPLHT